MNVFISSNHMSRIPSTYLVHTDPCKYIVIPSIIHVRNTNRSVFTGKERLEQTIHQLRSIRKHVDNVKIVLMEMSDLTDKEISELSPLVDLLWLLKNDKVLQYYAHTDPNKNKAELYVVHKFLSHKHIVQKMTHFAKFGGRYWFTKNSNQLFTHIPVAKSYYASCYRQNIVEPIFYSIPLCYIILYREFIKNAFMILKTTFTDNERLLYDLLFKNISSHNPSTMNIEGYSAVNGELGII